MEHLGPVGILLLGVMVLLVLWRAWTGRPVTVAEALVGVIAFVAIVAPLPIQSRPEAASAELSASAERDALAASLAELRSRLVALEEAARALQRQIEAVAAAVSSPAGRDARALHPEEQPLGGPASVSDTRLETVPIRFDAE